MNQNGPARRPPEINADALAVPLSRRSSWMPAAFVRGRRKHLEIVKARSVVHAGSAFPTSLVLIVAILLLAVGVFTIVSMITGIGPAG
jgi:hypothetical protein